MKLRLLLQAVLVAASLLPGLDCTTPNDGHLRGLYMGWIGMSNLGDELVLDIFGHLLRDALLQPGLFQRASLEYQRPIVHSKPLGSNYSVYDFAVLGGGSLLETSMNPRTPQCQGLWDANVPVYVHGTGTQLPYMHYTIGNHRCVEPPVWGGVRGPLTQETIGNLSSHFKGNLTGRELPVFGDSGILADRIFPRVSPVIAGTLDSARDGGSHDPVLCVSGAVQFGRPGTPEFRDTAQLIEEWSKEFIVVLLPVDPKTFHSQEHMRVDLLRSSRVKASRLFVNMHINIYGDWLAILSRCDLLLSVRLHAAVMAAAAGAPFVVVYSEGVPIKVKDFLLGTVGANWDEYVLKQSELDGSIAAVAELVRVAHSRAPRQRAAFNQAITTAYSSYMNSLREFVDAVLPNSFRSFTEVSIQMSRYLHGAILDLTFR